MVTRQPPPALTEEERLQRYGYRMVPRQLPGGGVEFDRVALTLDDLLHPQSGDVAVIASIHDLETTYLSSVFRARLRNLPHALVLHDCGVSWDVPQLRHTGERLGDYAEITEALEEARNLAEAHAILAAKEAKRADAAEKLAAEERKFRAQEAKRADDAEKLAADEARLKTIEARRADEEARLKAIEAKRADEEARLKAIEAKRADDATKLAADEKRLRLDVEAEVHKLREQLAKLRGPD